MNKKHYLLCLSLVTCIKISTGYECGVRYRTGGRSGEPEAGLIVGGNQARQGDFPWLVSIYMGGSPNCGGAIIHPEWVLTAAHCLEKKEDLSKSVHYGSLYHSSGKKSDVVQEIVHPSFIAARYYSDVALLKVSPPIEFTAGKYGKGAIGLICLPDPDDEYVGEATVAGWGRLKDGGTFSDHLLAVDVKLLENVNCASYPIFDPQVSLCAGFPGGAKDACQGDSGGPLQVYAKGKVYQIGIVSYGEGCGMEGRPGVYTKVQHFLPWIQETMANN